MWRSWPGLREAVPGGPAAPCAANTPLSLAARPGWLVSPLRGSRLGMDFVPPHRRSPRPCSWLPPDGSWFPAPSGHPVPASDTSLGGFLQQARLLQLCSLLLHLRLSLLGCFIPSRDDSRVLKPVQGEGQEKQRSPLLHAEGLSAAAKGPTVMFVPKSIRGACHGSVSGDRVTIFLLWWQEAFRVLGSWSRAPVDWHSQADVAQCPQTWPERCLLPCSARQAPQLVGEGFGAVDCPPRRTDADSSFLGAL